MTCIETTLYQNDGLPLWHNIQITEKLFLGGVYMTPGRLSLRYEISQQYHVNTK